MPRARAQLCTESCLVLRLALRVAGYIAVYDPSISARTIASRGRSDRRPRWCSARAVH